MSVSLIKSNIEKLLGGIEELIQHTRQKVAVSLNAESTLLYWSIGHFINTELKTEDRALYGKKILATVSQELSERFGKGYTYSALTRMCKVAEGYNAENIATLSQQLSWSHLIELATIEDPVKRQYYQYASISGNWGIRKLREKQDAMEFERSAIAKQPGQIIAQALSNSPGLDPDLVFKSSYVLNFLNLSGAYSEKELEDAILSHLEQFILELGTGFAFIERQKRISIDSIDYYIDLLFYHRKLRRLVVIDLKLGKFKPEYKAQMELYLRYLQKNEMQENEDSPIGLLLCSEGNTEHIELLMLDEKHIRVAQYLTELPNKQWFLDKLHKAIAIAQQNQEERK